MAEALSEPIIVMGKGVPAYSTKFGCLTYCIAGLNMKGHWLRLYPLFLERVIASINYIQEFDVIRVIYVNKKPESNRPESRKILPESIEIIGHVKKEKQLEILERFSEPGEFLHNDSWDGVKTLGMINPLDSAFFIDKGVPKVKFKCSSSCKGHLCEIGEIMKYDSVGRTIVQKDHLLEEKLSRFKDKSLRFVMGTIRRHPSRWLLISIHTL